MNHTQWFAKVCVSQFTGIVFAQLFTAQHIHVLNQMLICILVDCVGHYRNDPAVFFILSNVK